MVAVVCFFLEEAAEADVEAGGVVDAGVSAG